MATYFLSQQSKCATGKRLVQLFGNYLNNGYKMVRLCVKLAHDYQKHSIIVEMKCHSSFRSTNFSSFLNIFQTDQGPVVQKPINTNPGLDF